MKSNFMTAWHKQEGKTEFYTRFTSKKKQIADRKLQNLL